MEGGYQIIPLRHINLGAAPHTIKGIYRFIEENVADKAALLEGLRISGTDYNSIFTTFEKDPETGIYHGSFIVDKDMYTLIVRNTDTVNVTHINIKTIQTDASDIYDVVADEWNATTTYAVGSYAIYQNTLYKCLLQNSGQNPSTATSYWQKTSITAMMETSIGFPNAASHNGIYRGKNLGGAVTAEQYSAISSGTFNDLYIGDYWTIGGRRYRIAGFDYYLNCGSTSTTVHHVAIVPDNALYNHAMNPTNTTQGAYVGSNMYIEGLEQAKSIINSDFSGHVLSHKIFLNNNVSNGRPSGGSWYDSEVDIMNEQMVYGCGIFSPVSDGTNVPYNARVEKSQLPLFALEPGRICNRATWWLRDAISTANFTRVDSDGIAGYGGASVSIGVRPVFCIY